MKNKIYGVGFSIASTILHFIYPDDYPIIDVRTIEALQLLGYLDKDTKMTAIRGTKEGYDSYRSKIFEISKKSKRTLREVDKALFKYHKIKSLK